MGSSLPDRARGSPRAVSCTGKGGAEVACADAGTTPAGSKTGAAATFVSGEVDEDQAALSPAWSADSGSSVATVLSAAAGTAASSRDVAGLRVARPAAEWPRAASGWPCAGRERWGAAPPAMRVLVDEVGGDSLNRGGCAPGLRRGAVSPPGTGRSRCRLSSDSRQPLANSVQARQPSPCHQRDPAWADVPMVQARSVMVSRRRGAAPATRRARPSGPVLPWAACTRWRRFALMIRPA